MPGSRIVAPWGMFTAIRQVNNSYNYFDDGVGSAGPALLSCPRRSSTQLDAASTQALCLAIQARMPGFGRRSSAWHRQAALADRCLGPRLPACHKCMTPFRRMCVPPFSCAHCRLWCRPGPWNDLKQRTTLCRLRASATAKTGQPCEVRATVVFPQMQLR